MALSLLSGGGFASLAAPARDICMQAFLARIFWAASRTATYSGGRVPSTLFSFACLFLIQRASRVAVRLLAAHAPAAPCRPDRPSPGELSWAREAGGYVRGLSYVSFRMVGKAPGMPSL